jgi:hypothetical protein
MTYDVTMPETAQEHKAPLIPTHNIIDKKICNTLLIIHNYQARKDVLQLKKRIFQTLSSFFLYSKNFDIHLLQTYKYPLLQV